ncbi:MAG: nuclear transport factor 2 family protein [Myxococcota bacterium]
MSSPEAEGKALLRRWYDEMWGPKNFALVPELAGPEYTRHDVVGDRTVTAEEYRDQITASCSRWVISDFHYFLMAEGHFVTAIGTWKINGEMQWDWVQTFRWAEGKLVETWLPAMATEGRWTPDVLPR